jgi:hypothetical protein
MVLKASALQQMKSFLWSFPKMDQVPPRQLIDILVVQGLRLK